MRRPAPPLGVRRVLVPEKLFALLRGEGIPESALVSFTGELPEPSAVKAASAAVLWHRDPATLARHLLAHKSHWEWMHSLWTGLEHLPVQELSRAVKVFTTGKGTGAVPISEWVLAALLWHAKRLAAQEQAFRQGKWEPLELAELWESPVVVLGLGALGAAIARLLHKVGMVVTGVTRNPRPRRGCQQVVGVEALPVVCQKTRALVIALPATTSTRNLVNGEVLRALPNGSLVVNVGRAAVVEEKALFQEVASQRLWAALDVWWQEPLPPQSPWRQLPQLLPSPHGAYFSQNFRHRHLQRVLENLRAFLAGQPLKWVVRQREWRHILGEGGEA